jgi:hypothetical protein
MNFFVFMSAKTLHSGPADSLLEAVRCADHRKAGTARGWGRTNAAKQWNLSTSS